MQHIHKTDHKEEPKRQARGAIPQEFFLPRAFHLVQGPPLAARGDLVEQQPRLRPRRLGPGARARSRGARRGPRRPDGGGGARRFEQGIKVGPFAVPGQAYELLRVLATQHAEVSIQVLATNKQT